MVLLVPVASSNFTWLPAVQMPLTYDQFDIVKVFTMRGFVIVALGFWAWTTLTRGGKLRRTRVDWLIIAFLAWVALTTVLSIHPETALFGKYRRFEGLVSFITYAAIFFVTVQMIDRPAKMRSLARTLCISGLIVSGYGVVQFLGLDPASWGRLPFEANRAFSFYGNPDLLGGYLMFPLPVALAMALSEREMKWRAFYWVTFLVTVASWLTAFTRGAWIGGTVALLIVGFAAWRRKAKLEKVDFGFLGVTAAASAAIAAWSLRSADPVMNVAKRLVSIFQFGEGSAKTRFEIWEAAIAAVKDSPIVGHGPDTFRLLFPKYKPIEYVADAGYLSVADNVHNYPLQAATGFGIPGVILLYAIFVWALVIAAKKSFEKGTSDAGLLYAGFWAASAGYLVHLIFGLSVTGSTFLLWISVGVLLAAGATTVEIPGGTAAWRTAGAVLALVLMVALTVGNGVYIVADAYHLQARVGGIGPQERVEATLTSIKLNPFNDMYRAELGQGYQSLFLAWLNDVLQKEQQGADAAASQVAARAAFLDAERAMKDAIDFVPPEYDNYVFLANLYNLGGEYGPNLEGDFATRDFYAEALAIAERGIEVEPFGPAIRLQAAIAHMGTGDYEPAIEQLEIATDMDPRYSDGFVFLGEAYLGAGRTEDAIAALEHALEVDPANEYAVEVLARARGEAQ